MKNYGEFLTEHKDVIDLLATGITGPLSDARAWSAFGMLWLAATKEPWWSEFVSDTMMELAKISDILVKKRVSDLLMYIVHPQLFAVRLDEFLKARISKIVVADKSELN